MQASFAGPLDFDRLQLRLHPAASRVAKLSKSSPVAFDLLAADGEDLRERPQVERRARLELLLRKVKPPSFLTPMTRDRATAVDWLARFEGAGLDDVVAKLEDVPYHPGKCAMLKIKHARTADCVVAGFRWHKNGDEAVGSLLLGLYDNEGTLHHVGITSAFTMNRRRELTTELAPLRKNALAHHRERHHPGRRARLPRSRRGSASAAIRQEAQDEDLTRLARRVINEERACGPCHRTIA